MQDEEWPLTSHAIADAERAAEPADYELDDDEEPARGNALLRALVEEGRAKELAPGCYYVSKLDG